MKKILVPLIAIAALAATAIPASAGQGLRGGVRLWPIETGAPWKTGILWNATSYAQGGATTRAQVLDIHVPGQLVVSQPVLRIYACNATSTRVSPERRATIAGGSSCQRIRQLKVVEGQMLNIAVPVWANGKYLAIQETAELLRKSVITTGMTWSETAVYPANPTAVRAPLPTTAPYAGLPVHYQPLPWKTPSYATHMAYSSEAWVCPTKAPNTNPVPLSAQGCNRVYRNNANNVDLATFTLSGRVRKELTEWQYIYFVGYDIIDPDGPLGPQTYMVRSKATRIKPIPAPRIAVTTSGTTITAQIAAPMKGAHYQMSTFLNGKYGKVVQCTGVAVVTCTANVRYSGSWRIHVTPLGRQAVGKGASRTVVVTSLPQAPQ